MRRAVEGVDVVYHIAATYREAGQPDSAYRAINVDGTRNVLEAAQAAGVTRVVHCSTGGVHGHIANPPANEDAPFNPGDVYQETKLAAETLAREFGTRTGLDVVVARPIGIYGPGRPPLPDDVSRPGARTVSDDRQRPAVLSPDLHRRPGRRLSVVRHGAGGERPHLYPGGPALHDARATRAAGRRRN